MRRRECIEQNLADVVRFDDRRYIIRKGERSIIYRTEKSKSKNEILIAASHKIEDTQFPNLLWRVRACLLLNDTAKRT